MKNRTITVQKKLLNSWIEHKQGAETVWVTWRAILLNIHSTIFSRISDHMSLDNVPMKLNQGNFYCPNIHLLTSYQCSQWFRFLRHLVKSIVVKWVQFQVVIIIILECQTYDKDNPNITSTMVSEDFVQNYESFWNLVMYLHFLRIRVNLLL